MQNLHIYAKIWNQSSWKKFGIKYLETCLHIICFYNLEQKIAGTTEDKKVQTLLSDKVAEQIKLVSKEKSNTCRPLRILFYCRYVNIKTHKFPVDKSFIIGLSLKKERPYLVLSLNLISILPCKSCKLAIYSCVNW